MNNFTLDADEVILHESIVNGNAYTGLLLTLTSKKIVLEKEKGFFKKERILVQIIELQTIKFYNETAQIKQKGLNVDIQSTTGNITLTFSSPIEARKFTGKIIDAVTGTTLAKRSSEKVKDAFELADDTLGLDTRGTIKSVLEQGIKGALWNGTGQKK